MTGSSPRTWGTGTDQCGGAGQGRFIPTHVGNRWQSALHPLPRPVHPHARGEQSKARRISSCSAGSSPRTWGTDKYRRWIGDHRRFIPTHVGNRRHSPRQQ